MCDLAPIQILLKVRIHILVKTPRGNRVAGRLGLKKHLHKPEGLAGLVEALSRFCRYPVTVGCNRKKFLLSYGILTACCLFSCQNCIAACIMNGNLTADDHSLEESGTLRIISLAHGMGSQLGFCLSHDSFVTDLQHFPVFYSYMAYAIIKVISRSKNIMLNSPDRFRCHIRSGKFTGGFAFPVFICLMKSFLCLISNIKRVSSSCLNCIKFIF